MEPKALAALARQTQQEKQALHNQLIEVNDRLFDLTLKALPSDDIGDLGSRDNPTARLWYEQLQDSKKKLRHADQIIFELKVAATEESQEHAPGYDNAPGSQDVEKLRKELDGLQKIREAESD